MTTRLSATGASSLLPWPSSWGSLSSSVSGAGLILERAATGGPHEYWCPRWGWGEVLSPHFLDARREVSLSASPTPPCRVTQGAGTEGHPIDPCALGCLPTGSLDHAEGIPFPPVRPLVALGGESRLRPAWDTPAIWGSRQEREPTPPDTSLGRIWALSLPGMSCVSIQLILSATRRHGHYGHTCRRKIYPSPTW